MPITLRVQTYRNEALPQQVAKRFDQLGGAIGRAVGNDLVLEDPSKYISRVHAKIDFRDGGYYLTDVGSNPSLINDRPVGSGRQMLLADGDRLNVGEYQLQVSVSPEAVALPPSPLQAVPVEPVIAPGLSVGIDDSLSGAKILDVGGSFDNASFDPLGVNLFDAPAPAQAAAPRPGLDDAAFWAPAQQPAAPAFRGAESDHISPEIEAFQMPVMTPAAPVIPATPALPPAPLMPSASSGMAIPDDYDPLADYLPPRLSAAPAPMPAAPAFTTVAAVAPAAPVEPVVHAAPVFIPEFSLDPAPPAADPASRTMLPPAAQSEPPSLQEQPEHPTELQTQIDAATRISAQPVLAPAPTEPLAATPVVQPAAVMPELAAPPSPAGPVNAPPIAAAAAVAPFALAPASDSEVIQALLRGLGMPELKTNRSAVELAELAGAMLREATSGTMGVLMARAMTKRESRLEMTMIASQANNPLKFFPDADSALSQMLSNALAGYMTPVRSYANAFDDLKAHELAIMAGMRAALSGVLQRFDPTAIEERLQVPTVMDKMLAANRKAKMWDRLVELYKEISNEADDDFQRLFGEKFAVAYEEQIQRLRQSRR